MRDGTVQGVALANGEECYAPVIASNADAQVTFTRLLDSKQLPPEFAEAVSRISYESASLKINVALEELPNFLACPGLEPGPHHRGTIHISPDQDYIERAFDDAKYGQPSQRPILECTIPSVVDPTVAPPGKHLMSIFVQYAPYHLRGATWDDLRESFADRCFALLNEYAPNFQRSVLARQVLTPLDLERTFNLTGGNIFQGAMTLNQLFACRPVPGIRRLSYSDPRALPLRGGRPSWRRSHGRSRRECRTGNSPLYVVSPSFSLLAGIISIRLSLRRAQEFRKPSAHALVGTRGRSSERESGLGMETVRSAGSRRAARACPIR